MIQKLRDLDWVPYYASSKYSIVSSEWQPETATFNCIMPTRFEPHLSSHSKWLLYTKRYVSRMHWQKSHPKESMMTVWHPILFLTDDPVSTTIFYSLKRQLCLLLPYYSPRFTIMAKSLSEKCTSSLRSDEDSSSQDSFRSEYERIPPIVPEPPDLYDDDNSGVYIDIPSLEDPRAVNMRVVKRRMKRLIATGRLDLFVNWVKEEPYFTSMSNFVRKPGAFAIRGVVVSHFIKLFPGYMPVWSLRSHPSRRSHSLQRQPLTSRAPQKYCSLMLIMSSGKLNIDTLYSQTSSCTL